MLLRKSCSENIQQIYRIPMPKCDFNKVALQRGCSLVNLLHISRTSSPGNTPRLLLLKNWEVAKFKFENLIPLSYLPAFSSVESFSPLIREKEYFGYVNIKRNCKFYWEVNL